MQYDRHDDVTTLADDSATGEIHLEETPVAGEEVRRQDEHGETTLVDTLPDRLLQYTAWQEVAMVDHRRDLMFPEHRKINSMSCFHYHKTCHPC